MEINHVFKKYKDNIIFSDLNIKLPDKGLFLIQGDNGCGKTTLLNIISGFVKYKGKVNNNNSKNLSFVNQNALLMKDYTIKQHLELFSIETRKLKKINMMKAINSYPDQLSTGQKQKLAVFLSLYSDRGVLLLDEPFANTDKKSRKSILEIIQKKREHKLIIIVSHNVDIIDDADGIINLNKSKVELKILPSSESLNDKSANKLRKNNLPIKNKLKYLKSGLFLSIIALIICISMNSIGFALDVYNKDIANSVDYNKFYLKSCKELLNGKFKINKCNNPSLKELEGIDYGYNYDYLLSYLYNRSDLKVMYYPEIRLMFGRYPLNENEVMASNNYSLGEVIDLEANVDLSDIMGNRYSSIRQVEIVGIYNDLKYSEDKNLYFDYYLLDQYFNNTLIENKGISLKNFYAQLDFDVYKYLSFKYIRQDTLVSDGEKYTIYQNIYNLIGQIEKLLNNIIVMMTIYIFYYFIKINKNSMQEDLANICFLKSHSFSCFNNILKKVILTLIPFSCIMLLDLMFSTFTHIKTESFSYLLLLFNLFSMYIIFYASLFYRKNRIGEIMRAKI